MPIVGNCFDRRCPAREILAHVTGRWGSLVLAGLREAGVLRFSELRNHIDGISEKMLAQTLRDLERDGLLVRTSRPVVPPYVDYRLTTMGAGVAEHIDGLVRWIEAHVGEFTTAQREHDQAS
ncbi:MAG: helix-turn-helix transcriptional regulator [Candidatus Eremiobacteraeota bacterium]|nr:helix-turn-helix transcriptional regulator [Candidatus Eremiobacteraeota bacterium]